MDRHPLRFPGELAMRAPAPSHTRNCGSRTRRRLLQMLAASALGSALPVRIGAADRTPAPGTMDYCTTPARFDQRLRVPGSEGLLGLLRMNSDVLALDAVTRSATPGLAVVARVAGREYADPTLVV